MVFAFPRCAQIVAPTGGPRDSLPPNLIASVPPDSTLFFKTDEITLTFDEFIQLQDLQKQMIIAPNPTRQPEVRAKLHTVTIQWNDTLKPRTTYTINMGNAIADLNEGNPIKNFRYVFSTGGYLDSLEVAGRILDAETGLPDSLMSVMLYNNLEDSVVTKNKPVYYTRTVGDGTFLFQNLPHGTFKLFAIKDGNGDLVYDDSTEAIAFVEKPLKLDRSLSGINLYDFLEKENMPAQDTSARAVPGKGKTSKRTLTAQMQLNDGRQDLNRPLIINFNFPLNEPDSTRLRLLEDTTRRRVQFSFHEDTSRKTIQLAYAWKEDMDYRLIIDTSFATDTGGLRLPGIDTLNFKTKSQSDYGSLTLRFDNPGSADSLPAADSTMPQVRAAADWGGQYVIQLMQNDALISSAPLKGNTWQIGFLNPGDYEVRVLRDDNRNGVWDRGCYYCGEKRQPEEVFSISGKFNIKANWDNDFNHLKFYFMQ